MPPKIVVYHCSTWTSACTLTLAVCLQGAYLLAVLAENPCTHQCFKAEGCVELLLDLMHQGGPRAARAANAAVVSLAANADNHFGLVSLGLAPALVATLQAGKSLHTAIGARYMLHKYFRLLLPRSVPVLGAKLQRVASHNCGTPSSRQQQDGIVAAGCPMAQAMACSTMQMLCVVEPRHAAVLLRAGAAPMLVAFVQDSGADQCVRGNAAGVLASLAQLRDCQVGCKSKGLCRSSCGLLGQY